MYYYLKVTHIIPSKSFRRLTILLQLREREREGGGGRGRERERERENHFQSECVGTHTYTDTHAHLHTHTHLLHKLYDLVGALLAGLLTLWLMLKLTANGIH